MHNHYGKINKNPNKKITGTKFLKPEYAPL
jgi:hypothetical protein